MARDTILAPSFPILLERLVKDVVCHHREDPLAPELVLVPTSPLARFVESALASGSPSPLLNVQVVPFRWAAERLAGRSVELLPPPSPVVLECATRYLLLQRAPDLAALRGADRMLMATFNELLDAGLHDTTVVAELMSSLPTGARDRRTLELYLEWRDLLESRGLAPPQLMAARVPLAVDARWAHVFGFLRLEGAAAELVDRIADSSPDLHLAVYCPCHPDALRGRRFGYDYVVGHVEERHMLYVSERLERPSYRASLFDEIDGLLAHESGSLPGDAPLRHVRLAAAAGEAGEVEAAVRTIAGLLAESRFWSHPEAIALLAPDISTYEPFIRPALADMDIPARWLRPLSANHHPAVRWMCSVLSVAQEGCPASTVRELLTSPYARYPDPWPASESTELAARLAELGDALLAGGEVQIEGAEPWGTLVSEFLEERARLCRAVTAAEFVSLLREFLRRWVQPAVTGDGGVLEGWSRSREMLLDLDRLRFLKDEEVGERLLLLCRDSLEATTLPASHERGIIVGSIGSAAGMAFDHVFVLGANRASLPRPAREDPFLSDATRSRMVNELGYAVALRSDLPLRDRLLFVLTLLSARERAWVFYQHADANGAAKSPSLLLPLLFGPGAAKAVQHHTDRTTRLVQLAEEGAVDLTCREIATIAVIAGDLSAIERVQPGLGPQYTACLRRSREVVHARERIPDATGFDLRTAPPRHLEAAMGTVESWADLEACPYRFFMSRILGLREAEAAGPLWEPSASDRGNLVHEALERALRGGIPGTDEVACRTRTAWHDACASFMARHQAAATPGLLSLELARAESWIVPLLESEIELLRRRAEAGGGLTIRTEVRVEAILTLPDARIPLRVRFDRREDRTERGCRTGIVITDYKVRTTEKGAERDTRSLQAFLYAEAVESAFGGRPDFEYVEIVQGGDVATLRIPGEDAAVAGTFRAKAEYLLRCAREGVWFMRENRGMCESCAFRRVCRRYDPAIAAKAKSLGAGHEQTLKALDDELTRRLKPLIVTRYGPGSHP